MVPAGKREAVLSVLDDQGIDYALSDETSSREYTAVVWFPLPVNAVQPVLDALREAGLERNAYTVVLDAETVISEKFEQLEAEYEREEGSSRISRDELLARAEDLAPDPAVFVSMTVLSAIVATAGLLLDSPAVVVGSMVIAPLVGPAMATSVGTVVDDHELFLRGVKLQVIGGLLAVGAAAAFGALVRSGNIVPLGPVEVLAIGEVRERLVPDVLSLAVALAAGVAGALSLTSGVSTALVGVMIAAALVPPTAVVGVGLAWGRPAAIIGSGVLVLVNFLSINFAALAVMWYQGYRPEKWFREDAARKETLQRIAALGVGILVLTAFLGGVTFASHERASFEQEVQSDLESLAAANGLTLLDVDVEYGESFPFQQPRHVVVTLGHSPGVNPPSLAGDVVRIIENAGDPSPLDLSPETPTTVEVRYVTVESTNNG